MVIHSAGGNRRMQPIILNLPALTLRGYRSSCSTGTFTVATLLVHPFFALVGFKKTQKLF